MPSLLPMLVVPAPRIALENDARPEYECYCGLGPACPIFGKMTPVQRAACTRDKRQAAQWMYVNLMDD